jgi:hypothetical protein
VTTVATPGTSPARRRARHRNSEGHRTATTARSCTCPTVPRATAHRPGCRRRRARQGTRRRRLSGAHAERSDRVGHPRRRLHGHGQPAPNVEVMAPTRSVCSSPVPTRGSVRSAGQRGRVPAQIRSRPSQDSLRTQRGRRFSGGVIVAAAW